MAQSETEISSPTPDRRPAALQKPMLSDIDELPEAELSAVRAYLEGVQGDEAVLEIALGYDYHAVLRVTARVRPGFRLADMQNTIRQEQLAYASLGRLALRSVRFGTCIAAVHVGCGCARYADVVEPVASAQAV